MKHEWDDYDEPHRGRPQWRDYGHGDAGYRGGGFLGGDWAGGRRLPDPSLGQSGSMWGPPDRDFFPRRPADDEPHTHRGRGPRNYRRSDERIREDVCDRLTLDDRVDASDIEVTVADTVVTLSGTVGDRDMKRRAERIAESVTGVNDVLNTLRISTAQAGGT